MHDDQPTLIMVKRAIAGPDIITPGMGYQQARKQMLHAEGLDAGGPCGPAPKSTPLPAKSTPDLDPGLAADEIKDMAEHLYEVARLHKEQADKLMGQVQDDSHDDSDSHGDKKELS